MSKRSHRAELFRPGRTIHGNVVLNFLGRPETEFTVYASAFWRAGRSLAKSLAAKQGYRDMDACPIVFLYRHALELYMKAIVRRGHDLISLTGKTLPLPPDGLNRHELTPFLKPIRYIFKHLGWTWKTSVEGAKTFQDFEALVRDIHRFDSGSYSFRYPINTKGKGSVSYHFVFNVLNSRSRSRERLDFSTAQRMV